MGQLKAILLAGSLCAAAAAHADTTDASRLAELALGQQTDAPHTLVRDTDLDRAANTQAPPALASLALANDAPPWALLLCSALIAAFIARGKLARRRS